MITSTSVPGRLLVPKYQDDYQYIQVPGWLSVLNYQDDYQYPNTSLTTSTDVPGWLPVLKYQDTVNTQIPGRLSVLCTADGAVIDNIIVEQFQLLILCDVRTSNHMIPTKVEWSHIFASEARADTVAILALQNIEDWSSWCSSYKKC